MYVFIIKTWYGVNLSGAYHKRCLQVQVRALNVMKLMRSINRVPELANWYPRGPQIFSVAACRSLRQFCLYMEIGNDSCSRFFGHGNAFKTASLY